MRLESFFENFELLAEAPNGVQKLRELVLQLAVQGKLAAQDSRDEQIPELFQRLEQYREMLESKGKIRKQKPYSPVAAGETPFEIPASWKWVRLGEIGDWGAGATPSRGNSLYYGGSIKWFKSGELNDGYIDESEEAITEQALQQNSLRLNQPGDVLIAMYGATIGKLAILQTEATTNQAVCACTCYEGFYNRFLFLVLRAYRPYFTGQGAGGAQPNISRVKIVNTAAPLPPFEEQKRIVAKVDELMALCDKLEQRQQKRNEARGRLNKASLNALTTSESSPEFNTHWRRVTENFHHLYTSREAMNELRQAILQLAVQGKLVPQDPNDEPAEKLLEHIWQTKEELYQQDIIARPMRLPDIELEEQPFSLPTGWFWSRLGNILVALITGPFGSSLHKADYVNGGTPVINPASIKDGRVFPIESMAVNEATLQRLASFKLKSGDIVMARRGEMGRCAVVTENEDGWLCGTGSLILRFSNDVFRPYLAMLIGSEYSRAYLSGSSVGSTMSNLNQRILLNLPVGLPPLSEQKHIVAKVDQLMTLCDELEAKLERADSDSQKLVEAVVHWLEAA